MIKSEIKTDFLKSTAILARSSIAVKILSAVYRIPLARMLGAEGMGRYTASFNIFMPFFSFATAGITPTISRLCAGQENMDSADLTEIRNKSIFYFGILSGIIVLCVLAVSACYSYCISSPMIFFGVALLCPNLLFATFESVYKGIGQGTMNMSVTAKANILESGAKVLVGILGIYIVGKTIKSNTEDAQLLFAFFTVSFCGMICRLYMKNNFNGNCFSPGKSNFKVKPTALFSMSVPISVSALAVSLTNFFDTVISLSIVKKIPDSALVSAYPFASFAFVDEKAIWLFGIYQGLCLSVVNLIPSVAAAIGSAGLPIITKAVRTNNRNEAKKQIDKIIKFTSACVVPVSMFVMFFAQDVLITLFGDRAAQTVIGGKFLKIMALPTILSAFSFPLNAVLHAREKSNTILKILVFACTVKVVLSTYLCGISQINIMGCIYSQIIFQIIVFILSIISIRKFLSPINIFKRLAIPMLLSYVLLTFIREMARFVLYSLPTVFKTFVCGGTFVGIYTVVLIFTGFFIDK